jgi:hypothetical protein
MATETKWPIPKAESTIPRKTIELEHEEYKARLPYWEFFRHSDELTGGYAASTATYTGIEDPPTFDETYLVPHVKETSTDFELRVALASPPRYVQEGIESITGVLTQQQPNRDSYPDQLKEWTTSVSVDGATLQQWISSELWPLVERYGLCYSYARRPDIDAPNLEAQQRAIKAAGLPEVLLHVITPENLPWWSVDDKGEFEIVRYTEQKIEQKIEDGYVVDETDYVRHWWVTHEGWWYADDNEAANNTGLVVNDANYWNKDQSPMKSFPISKWFLNDERGPTETAAFAQLAYFRTNSELQAVELAAAFPMTWIPESAGDENPAEVVKGADQVGAWDASEVGGAKPMILETSGVSLAYFMEKRLPALEEAALSPYGRQREVGGNDSGVALAHIQQTAINIYRQHAKAGSRSEFAAMQPVAELLGVEIGEDARAAWPRKYGTLSDSSQADILTQFWDLDPGDDFKRYILSEFSDVALADLTADQLEEALDTWQSEQDEKSELETAFLSEGDGETLRRDSPIGQPAAANPQQVEGGPEKER